MYKVQNPVTIVLASTAIESLISSLINFSLVKSSIQLSIKPIQIIRSISNAQGGALYLNKLVKSASQNIDSIIIGSYFDHSILAKFDLLKKISTPIIMTSNSLFMAFNFHAFKEKKLNIDLLYKYSINVAFVIFFIAIIYLLAVSYVLNFLNIEISKNIKSYQTELSLIIIAFALRAALWWPRFITIYQNAWLSITATLLTTIILAVGLIFVSDLESLLFISFIYFTAYLVSFVFWYSNLINYKRNKLIG